MTKPIAPAPPELPDQEPDAADRMRRTLRAKKVRRGRR